MLIKNSTILKANRSANLITNYWICDHLGGHKQIKCKDQLGYYLAGLIEGGGHFSATKLEIPFHIKDKSAAYRLRRYLGFGQINSYNRKQLIEMAR